jgi:GNAT superfamily N-acetyltransferase
MVDTKALLRASLEASKEFLKAPVQASPDGDDASDVDVRVRHAPLIVPIRSLDEAHRERIERHLLTLDGADRYLRFGYSASDEHISRYVEGLNFERDEIFGVYSRKLELVAMAHLAFIGQEAGEGCKSCAEFGVSVLKESRGLGLGAALFDRAAMHARNDGIELMFIHALSENNVMLKIARNAGARVEQIGSESEAYLRLTPATLDSRFTEIVEEQVAQMDYRLKVQAKQFWDFWASLQQRARPH